MKREIKFRAYHKVRKEMYSVHGWHSEYVFKETLDGVGCEGNPDKLEDVELMQFTGLKDKNGVDIYEGDIVDTHPFHIRSHRKHRFQEVLFDNGFFLAEKSDFGWEGENLVDLNHCEVIGNIHEHKHLI